MDRVDELPMETERIERRSKIQAFLKDMGHPTVDMNLIDQLEVMVEAFDIFVERESSHGSLWKQYGAGDTAFHLKSKALRVVNNPENIDDALDAINYAAFTVRNMREGRV